MERRARVAPQSAAVARRAHGPRAASAARAAPRRSQRSMAPCHRCRARARALAQAGKGESYVGTRFSSYGSGIQWENSAGEGGREPRPARARAHGARRAAAPGARGCAGGPARRAWRVWPLRGAPACAAGMGAGCLRVRADGIARADSRERAAPSTRPRWAAAHATLARLVRDAPGRLPRSGCACAAQAALGARGRAATSHVRRAAGEHAQGACSHELPAPPRLVCFSAGRGDATRRAAHRRRGGRRRSAPRRARPPRQAPRPRVTPAPRTSARAPAPSAGGERGPRVAQEAD